MAGSTTRALTKAELITAAIADDWGRSHRVVKRYRRLPKATRSALANALIERLDRADADERLAICQFFRGHLHLSEVPVGSARMLVRAGQRLANDSTSPPELLIALAGAFHSWPLGLRERTPPDVRLELAELLLELSRHEDPRVRAAAVKNFGTAYSNKHGSPEANSRVLHRCVELWRSTDEAVSVVEAIFRALADFTSDLDNEAVSELIAEITIEGLAHPIAEYRKGAVWVIGNPFQGVRSYRLPHQLRQRAFELLLQTMQEVRDIPDVWWYYAFQAIPGKLPAWAAERVEEGRRDELRLEDTMSSAGAHDALTDEQPQYGVALSFAGEDREIAVQLARLLDAEDVEVFYDDWQQADLWGKDLYQHLAAVYGEQAKYCVVFVSQHYVRNLWPRHELQQAQARAFSENQEYILPLRMDDTKLPAVPDTIGYVDLRETSIERVATLLLDKLRPKRFT